MALIWRRPVGDGVCYQVEMQSEVGGHVCIDMARPLGDRKMNRKVLVGGLVLLGSATAWASDQFAYPRAGKSSFWYQPIPYDVTLHKNSAAFNTEFVRQVTTYYGVIGLNAGDYSAPVYTVSDNIPKVNVTYSDCYHGGHTPPALIEQFTDVPIPPEAIPAGGTDAEFDIWQPSSDTLWEFWAAGKVDGVWRACWGGRIDHLSKSSGIMPYPYGGSATGLPYALGQVEAEEVRRGHIDHVIGIALHDVEAGELSWPANRTDGYNPTHQPNWIREGQRFRIDPSIDLKALNLHPVAYAIAKAGQTYGFVVWDKGGSVALRLESPKRYTVFGLPNPWVAIYNGAPFWSIMNRFPWRNMQFLPIDYGKP